MKDREYIVKKELAKNEFDIQMQSTFKRCYSCTRVWSAWSYDTMSQDDFNEMAFGDEAFDEFYNHLHKMLCHFKIESIEYFIAVIENQLNQYELFYNEDIESRFDSIYFDNDIFNYLDIATLYDAAVKYQKYCLVALVDNEIH